MSSDATTIVLRDGDGAYYLLTSDLLEAARVPVVQRRSPTDEASAVSPGGNVRGRWWL